MMCCSDRQSLVLLTSACSMPLLHNTQLSQVVEIEIERPANGQAATFGKTATLLRSRTAKTRTDSEGMPVDGLLM